MQSIYDRICYEEAEMDYNNLFGELALSTSIKIQRVEHAKENKSKSTLFFLGVLFWLVLLFGFIGFMLVESEIKSDLSEKKIPLANSAIIVKPLLDKEDIVVDKNGMIVPEDEYEDCTTPKFVLSHNQAQYENHNKIGALLYSQGEYSQAFLHFSQAAKTGSACAQYNLGIMYESGKGIPLDKNKALYWYRQATIKGLKLGGEKIKSLRNSQ